MINKNVNILFKTAIVIVAILFVTANVIAQTIVVPDAIFPEGPTRSPANEQIANAIDKNPQTKFLNFHKIGSGFTVVFQTPVVINEIQFTTANDDYGRDPLEVIISGSSESMNSGFSEIATVSLPKTAARFTPYGNTFTNATAYKYYRVIVTAIDKPTAGAVQFAEVDFFKSGSPTNSTQPTVVTQPVAPIDPSGGEVAQLNARVAELEGQLSAATAAQGPLNAKVAELEGQLSAATASQGPLNAKIAELEAMGLTDPATQPNFENRVTEAKAEILDKVYDKIKECEERDEDSAGKYFCRKDAIGEIGRDVAMKVENEWCMGDQNCRDKYAYMEASYDSFNYRKTASLLERKPFLCGYTYGGGLPWRQKSGRCPKYSCFCRKKGKPTRYFCNGRMQNKKCDNNCDRLRGTPRYDLCLKNPR